MKSMKCDLCDEALDSGSQKQKIALGCTWQWHLATLCPGCSLLSCLLIGAAGVARCFCHAGSAADAGRWVCGVSCGFQTATATVQPCPILSQQNQTKSDENQCWDYKFQFHQIISPLYVLQYLRICLLRTNAPGTKPS